VLIAATKLVPGFFRGLEATFVNNLRSFHAPILCFPQINTRMNFGLVAERLLAINQIPISVHVLAKGDPVRAAFATTVHHAAIDTFKIFFELTDFLVKLIICLRIIGCGYMDSHHIGIDAFFVQYTLHSVGLEAALLALSGYTTEKFTLRRLNGFITPRSKIPACRSK
jgi:hypothetical protein